MPYIGNVLTSFAVETGNINDQAVTAPKLSATGGTNGQVLALDAGGNLVWTSDPAGQWVTIGSDIYYDTGLVGIGTSAPSGKLEVGAVAGSVTAGDLIVSTGSGAASVTVGRLSSTSGDGTTFRVRDRLNNTVFVVDSGLVGIGTTSPSSPLTIESSAGNQVKITYPSIASYFLNATSGGDFAINKDGTERLRITSAGLVGIGTSAPGSLLQVGTGALSSANVAAFLGGSTTFENATTGSGPSITFNNDTDTGILNPSGNTLGINTGGTRAITISDAQRVGIGVTGPQSPLHVNGTGDVAIQITNGTTGTAATDGSQITVENPSMDLVLRNRENATIRFLTNNTERARIDASGRVGIGTSSPQAVLESKTASVQPGDAAYAKKSVVANIPYSTSNITSSALAVYDGTIHAADIGYSYDGSGYYLALGTSLNTVSAPTERVRIDRLGNVGIGTSSVDFSNFGSNTGGVAIQDIGGTNTGLKIGDGSNDNYLIAAGNGSFYQSHYGSGSMIFGVGNGTGTERMRIGQLGYLKASNNGLYFGATATYHERNNNAADWVAIDRNSNATPFGVLFEFDSDPNGTGNQFWRGRAGGVTRAELRSNGGIANFSANNANLSDRNAKKDITPAVGTWNCIKDWEIVNYRYKDQSDDADLNLGVIAQQVAESCPEVITVFEEAKDDQPEKLGVKEQQMYWMAIKALQEAQVRIETLEAKVEALEAA